MSERKQQGWFVPLRVRFRSPAEHAQLGRESGVSTSIGRDDSALEHHAQGAIRSLHAPEPKASRDPAALAHGFQEAPDWAPTSIPTSAQHTRQIKQLIRLGNILRAELGLN